jgi:hypothetical protein
MTALTLSPAERLWRYRWSIAVYRGPDLLHLRPADPRNRPALTARHVTDRKAGAVADPFVIRRQDDFLMFFEILNMETGLGEIAYASSDDGLSWTYREQVMDAEVHLSYPQVFEWEGAYYMIPETRQAGEIRLYRADAFPREWRLVKSLLQGRFADATLFQREGLFWLFAQRGLDELRLYFAESPMGPWSEHPASPLWAGNRRASRCGGRLFEMDGRLLRFAQDGWPSYGTCLRAFEIDRLDRTDFSEREVPESPVLSASKEGWNALAMHHLEVICHTGSDWLVAVDGATIGLGGPG